MKTALKKKLKIFNTLLIILYISYGLPILPLTYGNVENELESNMEGSYAEGEILIKYRDDKIDLATSSGRSKANSMSSNMSIEKREHLEKANIGVFEIKDGKSVEEKIREIEKDPDVEYAEPNYKRMPVVIDTNDTYKDLLWGLHNYGQSVRGTSGLLDADIDAPEAWNLYHQREVGDSEVIVAIIDDGVAYNHPDLINNMWDGSQCKDNMGNYLGGCIHGYDYQDEDKDPLPTGAHGTHIAGIIGAERNNNIGVLGVAPDVKIMAIRFDLYVSTQIKAIDFAIENGAKIINASYVGEFFSQSEYDAINRFRNAGGIFVAAAGNYGTNNDTSPLYPASHILDNIISVTATDQSDNLAYFSNYGSTSVDVAAPGTNIYSTEGSRALDENFDSLTSPDIGTNFTQSGDSTWGTRNVGLGRNIVGDHANWGNYIPNIESHLDSLVINLNGKPNSYLGFRYQCHSQPEVDGVKLYLWNGTAWDYSNKFYTGYNTYGTVEIPLSDYAIEDFKFRFTWTTGDSDGGTYNGCSIDDIKVVDSSSTSGSYMYAQGTSMSTPYVAALAAMLWAYEPTLSMQDVRSAILNTGDSLVSLDGKASTGKRVNALNALVEVASFEEQIVESFKFQLGGADYPCIVNRTLKRIDCRIPRYVSRTNLAPIISLSGGTISPPSGVANNFLVNTTYTFTKSNNVQESYTVNLSNYFSVSTGFRSGVGNWSVPNTKHVVIGDFSGNGVDQIVTMYDYGFEDMALIMFDSYGNIFDVKTAIRSGRWNWSVDRTRHLVAGDFNGDGKDEIVAMYDYGNEEVGIVTFASADGISFYVQSVYRSGPGNWIADRTKYLVAGDFNGDGTDQLLAMYDYGDEDMALIGFVFGESKLTTSTWVRSGRGNWVVERTKHLVVGDFNGDGRDQLIATYDYGNEDMGIISVVITSGVFNNATWFRSGPGNWVTDRTIYLIAGDYNGDSRDQLVAMYDYGNEDMALIAFLPTIYGLTTSTWLRSGPGNWSIGNTKYLIAGDIAGSGLAQVTAVYDYGFHDMALLVFK